MTQPRTAREQLAQELKYLRESAGLSERDLADVLGKTQSHINRQETGRLTSPRSLSPKLIEDWAEATGADATTRLKLRMLVDAALRNDPSWKERLGDQTHLQEEMRLREAAAHTIRNFQPTIVPGLLQTPEYAKYVIRVADVEGDMDVEQHVLGRLRRQEALFTGDKQFEFLMSEAALRWPASHPDMLAAQLDRIVTLSSLKSVAVGVLPIGEPINVVAWSNFIILDGDKLSFIAMELVHNEPNLINDRDVGLYRGLYFKMWSRALVDQDAVALIRRIAAELRKEGE